MSLTSSSTSSSSNNVHIFKSDRHATIIFEKLQSFYEENEFFDIVLVAGKNCVNIQAHRFVLCSFSKYFSDIFRDRKTPLDGNVLEIKEIEASTLKYIINFMYSGSIEISLETVDGVLRVANYLKIETLVDGCCEFIEKNVNSSNCLYWIRFAKELNLSRLKAKSLEFTYNHLAEVSKEERFQILSGNELKDLLFNDNPHGDFEKDVFLSMVAWINYDKINREHLTLELISLIRFQHLTAKFIVKHRKSVCKSIESYELICSWIEWHLSPETRSIDFYKQALNPRIRDKLVCLQKTDSNKIMIQTYNPEVDVWSKEAQIPICEDIETFAEMIVIDNKLIVVGGRGHCSPITNSVGYLDLHTFKWADLPPMKRKRSNCQVAFTQGYLCVFGHCDGMGSFVDSMEIYNLSTRKWYDIEACCQFDPNSKITAHNGILYILDYFKGFLHSYDMFSQKWILKEIKKECVWHFGFVTLEGFLYIIGGNGSRTVKRYNLSNDSWSEVALLPHDCSGKRATIFENKIAVCGYTETGVIVAVYNPDNDTWTSLSPEHSLKMNARYSTIICTSNCIK